MDDLSRKLRSLDWKSFQKSARKMQASTASALKDLVMTDLENKTRSATSDTPWGASTTDLMAIAQGTNNRDDYALIMSIIWQRLGSSRWRCVYKALEVLKYLLMHGSSRCFHEVSGALGLLESLRMYRKMEGGREVGEGVRTRAEMVVEMLRDETVLVREREKSDELRRKMIGGQGPYSVGRYDTGYEDSYGDNSVNRIGTSGFRGYGDDSNPEYKGYDDSGGLKGYGEPIGGSDRVDTHKPAVDDLLGGDDVPAGKREDDDDDDDDDDDFDPRGGGNEGVGELFGALSLAEGTSNTPAAANPASASVGAELTSAMVARLAAEKSGTMVVSDNTPASTGNSIWETEEDNSGAASQGVGVWADTTSRAGANGLDATPTTQSLTPAPKEVPMQLTRKTEEDPFGDLLATARKTVL